MNSPFNIFGVPRENSVLIVADHASNHVPEDIDLQISAEFLDDHIAVDIGTAAIAEMMTENIGYMSILAGISRLVTDFNRYPEDASVIPEHSDAIEILGNKVTAQARQDRLDAYYHPYHDRVKQLIADLSPQLILSLHSFSPQLRSNPEIARPWDIGVLYNEYDIASRFAIRFLEEEGLIVGDQLPYSGKDLNATMNRQAEAIGQPYFGIEIRQDLISDETGQRRFSALLQRTCDKIRTALA
ncbi:N-formylglutamate amidohydrolase [Parasphingorhabdus sp.]|jgi:predicted N-formylglutamate amidohydrolase|uniref:N-formylglutamate amidohydrolase n=1 Tax=Parasphingorhabdus sp. TaxID=2709688 RepID=UPI0007F536F1|nr:hypothetical protein A8B75_02735 [Sphingomonadales bacterium EhC05]